MRKTDPEIAAAILPWQEAVLRECRDYHQDANQPKHVMVHQVANAFAMAREDAAAEMLAACLAIVRKHFDRDYAGGACLAELEKLKEVKP